MTAPPRVTVLLLLVAACAVVCYANTLGNGFAFDDLEIIVRNPLVHSPETDLADIFASHYWQHVSASGDLHRPITVLTYRINHMIGGLDPSGYHLVNILFHALASCLVTGLALRLRFTPGAALVAGALFASHPVHTEAVAGVVGRADLVAAACVLGGWMVHLAPSPRRAARTAIVAVIFAVGLLSKENAVVLPALVLAGDLFRDPGGPGPDAARRDTIVTVGTLACVAIAWLGLRAWLLPGAEPGTLSDPAFAGVPAGARIATALDVMARYLRLLVFPLHLSADYSHQQIVAVTSWLGPRVLAGAGFLIACAALAAAGLLRPAARAPRLRRAGLCAAAFLIAIAPVSNIPFSIGTAMAERLLYLPSAAFCLAVPLAWPGRRSPAWRRAGAAAALLIVVSWSARTVVRNRDWKDQLTLFSVTVRTSPLSARAHFNHGVALDEAGRPDDALRAYRTAAALAPDDPKPLRNAALILAARDRVEEAAQLLERAAQIDPSLPGLLSDLGVVLARLGRPVKAEAALREALIRHPGDHEALYNLGTLLIDRGLHVEAVDPLEEAVRTDPSDADAHYHLGLAYRDAGRPEDAVASFERTIHLDPSIAEAHGALVSTLRALGRFVEAAAAARNARAAGVTLPPGIEDPPGR